MFRSIALGFLVLLALGFLFTALGCKVEGQYANAGEPCFFSGAKAVDEDSGQELECNRDKKGDLTWLVK